MRGARTLSSWQIVYFAIAVEGLLAVLGISCCIYFNIPIHVALRLQTLAVALGFAIFLLALQFPLRRLLDAYPERFAASNSFLKEVVLPFCGTLSVPQALLVSLAAGVGEELLFRAAIQPALGVLLSSLLFAVVHFGRQAMHYPFFLICYFLISMGLGLQYLWSKDIVGVIITHALYDFMAIQYYKSLTIEDA